MAADIEPELLDAVAAILDRDGEAGLSITAIAQEAGPSRVTLHRRGHSIDDYIVAVLGRTSDDLRASLWPVITGSGTAGERFAAALDVFCQVCERHTGVMMAMYGVAARPLPGRPGRTTSLEFIEPFERLLRDGLIDGTLHSDDPPIDATLVLNAVGWTYLHMRQAHGWSEDQARTRCLALAIDHLRPPRPGPADQ